MSKETYLDEASNTLRLMVHQTATCLHSPSAASYDPHQPPESDPLSTSWCSVDSSSLAGLSFAPLQRIGGDHSRSYRSHQDLYSVNMRVVLGFALASQLVQIACHCSFNLPNFLVITAQFASVRFWPISPTLGMVLNTEGFRESWNLSCISGRSSLPILAYTWKISTWSAKNFVRHHLKWRTWPRSGQNSTAFCGGGALGGACSFLSSGRSISLDTLSWSDSGYAAGSLTSIGKNVSVCHWKIGDSTWVLIGYSSCHCPETSLRPLVSLNTNEKHASCHLWTLHAPEAPR